MPNDSMRTVLVAIGADLGVALAKVGRSGLHWFVRAGCRLPPWPSIRSPGRRYLKEWPRCSSGWC